MITFSEKLKGNRKQFLVLCCSHVNPIFMKNRFSLISIKKKLKKEGLNINFKNEMHKSFTKVVRLFFIVIDDMGVMHTCMLTEKTVFKTGILMG